MDEQELQARLRSADPARGPGPADSWIDDLVGATMDTETSNERPRGRRPRMLVAAAAAAVAAIGGGALALADGGDDGKSATDRDAQSDKELALTLAPYDTMQMCMAFSPDALEPAEVAFSGVVDDVEGDTVRLTPDHWYRGGDGATMIVLTAGSPEVLLEGGITFEEGERYLVSAIDGQVATCGLSAPYSAEMAAAYDEAFGD